MRIYNTEIAKQLEDVADLLAIKGSDQFRIRAYRDAAITVRRQSQNIDDMLKSGKDLSKLPNIGKDISKKIQTIVKTGKLPLLSKLEKKFPRELLDLLKIKGLGPTKVSKLYNELNIKSIDDLKDAINDGKLEKLEGFGKKTSKKLMQELRDFHPKEERMLLTEAIEVAKPFKEYIEGLPGVDRVDIVGSYRRRKETVGDLDMLVTRENKSGVFNRTFEYENIENILSKGETKTSVRLRNGLQVDLRVIDKENYAPAMIYFTGSKAHSIALRKIGQDKGWKVNEYGIFKGDKKFKIKTEEDFYSKFKMQYIPPELRENRGEIEVAKNHKLPKLIELKDIKGDLQIHTKLSDGENNIEEIAENCCNDGYKYLAITDHSSNIGVIRGVERGKIDQYVEKIRKVDEKYKDLKIIIGVEVDVLEDGRLFLQDHLLKQFDIVTFAIHSYFDLDEDKQTDRILRAMDNPYTNIFAHPTGRVINEREPYRFDFESVMNRAKENNIIMEINAQPTRLDLNDINAKAAKEIGVKFSISTDAHSIEEMQYMKYGIWQARRGWIEKKDVINTLGYKDLMKTIKR